MSNQTIVLNYGESLLRTADVDLLRGPLWLNDNLISFYYEYLSNSLKESAPEILFVPPEVTQCLKLISSTQIKVFLDPLNADEKKYIFFALNNNDTPQGVGGTHWSLVLYSREEKTCYHFDSCLGRNIFHAEKFANRIFQHFNVYKGKVIEATSIHQDNGYDCGIYLICNSEHLARSLDEGETVARISCVGLQPRVDNMRQEFIDLIMKLRKN